ncbi:hypothetical protein EPN29_05945 [bacterium]|nr:MAG: hypothetical protein EPN29_05945 [bacterium]
MSVPQVRLESIRLKTGGRVHLVPRVPSSGPVTTMCGRNLPEKSFAAVATEADCANCVRRSQDPSRISGAFFAQEEGMELLRLSLEQARLRRPRRPARRRPSLPCGPPQNRPSRCRRIGSASW